MRAGRLARRPELAEQPQLSAAHPRPLAPRRASLADCAGNPVYSMGRRAATRTGSAAGPARRPSRNWRPKVQAARAAATGPTGPALAAAGFVIATGMQMVGGELAPKNLALARAGRLAKWLAPSTLAYWRPPGR